MNRYRNLKCLFGFALVLSSSLLYAQDKKAETKEPATVDLAFAEGSLVVSVPGTWEKTKPQSNFIEFEFSIPKVEGDENNGRFTVSSAGGSIEANISRWYTQFHKTFGDEDESAKNEQETINDLPVHLVDLSGDFEDGSPMGAKVKRENYRMLAAIVETKDHGNYFLKLVGPKETMAKHEEGFKKMVAGLKNAK